MKRLLSAIGLSFVITFSAATNILAKDPPTSAEQLRSEVEHAYKHNDLDAITSLICWDGINDSEEKTMLSGMLAEDMTKRGFKATNFSLISVPTNFQATITSFRGDWQGDNGMRYKYNVPVIGMIHMNFLGEDQNDKNSDFPYGKKGNAFYLSQLFGYQLPGKALNVRVDNIPRFLTYTGYWVFVKEGKEISVPINDQTNEFRQGWGDYVKYCTVRRTTLKEMPGFANFFEYRITEDQTNIIFESGQITNEEPVIYERKQ